MVTVHVVDQKPIFQLHQQNRKMVALINFLYQGNSLFEVLAENFVPLNSEVFLNLSIAEPPKISCKTSKKFSSYSSKLSGEKSGWGGG